MSRIGQQPIQLPEKVKVTVDKGNVVTVSGPQGEVSQRLPAEMTIEVEDKDIAVKRPTDAKEHRALHGLTRSLLANMIEGVSQGFEKRLEIQGVGYRAQLEGKNLRLRVGHSHDVVVEPPEGIEFAVEENTLISVRGADKQLVGQIAAEIRAVRKVEPYKGKGIRYVGEHVRRKAGKAAKIGVA